MEIGAFAGPSDPCGPLCARVAALCADIGFREPHLNDQLAKLIAALREPLRVAFAGRVSMGKSTLVNALLQAPVAPSGDGETTRVVNRFEGGDFERVELILRDDSRRQAFLTPAGVLPPAYPVPNEQIREVRVLLPYAPILNRITLVDTPGLESLNEAVSNRTSESLFSRDSRAAIADADALVYMMGTGTTGDEAAVAAFNELTAPDLCALNAVGVLNCKSEHPVSAYAGMARRLREDSAFRYRLADVIPVACLLAYASASAMLTEGDTASLRTLAGYEGEDLFADVDSYLAEPCDVDRQQRRKLLDMLGFSGLRTALDTVRSTAEPIEDLNAVLLEKSGLPRLLHVINGTFADCADQIKAGQTLAAVTRLSYQAERASGQRARIMIGALRGEPDMHGIEELWALQQCSQPDLELPEWVMTELARVAAHQTARSKTGLPDGARAQDVLEVARAGASRAHAYGVSLSATRPEGRIAETLRRSYTNIFRYALQEIEHENRMTGKIARTHGDSATVGNCAPEVTS